MTDLTKTIAAKSDQLNADDLIGRDLTITITGVSLLAGEQPVAISYEGDNGKPWKPCKSMRRVLVGIWGGDGSKYAGRSMTLYRDPAVAFGGQAVGGIRISHMSGIDKPVIMSLTASRNNKKPFTVKPLVVAAPDENFNEEALLIEATEAAKKGADPFREYWKNLSSKKRELLKPRMEMLKKTADAAAAEVDPFDVKGAPAAATPTNDNSQIYGY